MLFIPIDKAERFPESYVLKLMFSSLQAASCDLLEKEVPMSRKQNKQNRKKAYPVPNRNYKSSLFTMVFSDKKELLGLYNAVSGKQYKDPGALTVNTLENAIYMAIKNDLSFVIDSRLSLYEHQSTYSPNLPLRMLLYLADLYADLTKNENLYGRKKVMLPPPQFIIFYNGEEKQPDRRILRLSDLYEVEEEEHKLELEAVECTITECIREGILEEFLVKYRAEAKRMSIYEYDQARHIRQEREEAPSYLPGRDRKPAGLLAKGRSIKAGSCLRPDTGNGEGQ